MRQSTRLIVNTCSTYIKLACGLVLGLITIRLLIDALGQQDFGLLAVLGGTAAMLNMISNVLTRGAIRHLAYEIGRDDQQALAEVFNTNLVLYLAAGIVVMGAGLAAWPVLRGILNIPGDRIAAAGTTYHLILLTLVITTALTPFRAMITAHERIYVLDLMETAGAFLGLAAVLLLPHLGGDRLVVYAALMLPIQCAQPIAAAVLSLTAHAAARPRWSLFSLKQARRIASLAGWISLHQLGVEMRFRGAIIVVGAYFDTVTSAAYAVAVSTGRYQDQFASAIMRSAAPAMTTMAARGNRSALSQLVLLTDKYAALGTLYFVVPVLLDAQNILRIWLGKVPPGAPLLAQLVLTWLSIKVLTRGHGSAVIALGKLAGFVLPVTAMLLGSVAVAALLFEFLAAPVWTLPATAIVANILVNFYIVAYMRRRIDASFGDWWRQSVLPTLSAAAAGGLAACAFRLSMEETWLRPLMIALAYAVAASAATWIVALEGWERDTFRRVLTDGIARLRRRGLARHRS